MPSNEWKDTLARLRFERAKFAKMAAERRREAIELRKKRRWLDAMFADDRASEYRKSRDQWSDEIARIRAMGYR